MQFESKVDKKAIETASDRHKSGVTILKTRQENSLGFYLNLIYFGGLGREIVSIFPSSLDCHLLHLAY